MISWFTFFTMGLSAVVSRVCLAAAGLKKKPSIFSLSLIAAVEFLLLVQLVLSVVLVVLGQTSQGDIIEFFGYLLVAILVPVAAVFWALAEPTRSALAVLAVAGFTVSVMVARMAQIWGLF